MSDAVVGRADLQKKDRGELQTIITALGGKPSSRAKKDDLITMVLQLTGALPDGDASSGQSESHDSDSEERNGNGETGDADDSGETDTPEPDSGSNANRSRGRGRGQSGDGRGNAGGDQSGGKQAGENKAASNRGEAKQDEAKESGSNQGGGRPNSGGRGGRNANQQGSGQQGSGQQGSGQQGAKGANDSDPNRMDQGEDANTKAESAKDDDDDGNRRRRRRGRGRDREEEQVAIEPQKVGGNLDLRDEGYGFLRVDGALPSPDDVYIPLKTVRVHGLRKGDHVSGTARPAARNERNSALHSLDLINDQDPAKAKDRPHFSRLAPVLPTEALPLEIDGADTGRILDLVVPLGKGQRALIVAPPETGASRLLADIAVAVQTNHPESRLVVMMLNERPEDITDLSRRLDGGEIIASPFDRPPEEQVAVAEMAVERAQRMVEDGQDVVLLVDGLTALVRAYNLSAGAGGRLLGGGVDASAIYPSKRFFGAARALEEGGSLTMIATVVSETGSPVDELILDEFRGTATAEIHLSRHLADRGVFPAIDLEKSFNRAADKLLDSDEQALVAKFRQSIQGEDALATMKNLLDRVNGSASNAELLGAL